MPASTAAHEHHYAVLGLTNQASLDEIRSAYKKLALKWHPDRCPVDDKAGAAVKFVEINEAYNVLAKMALVSPIPHNHDRPSMTASSPSPSIIPLSVNRDPTDFTDHTSCGNQGDHRLRSSDGEPCKERSRARYATVPDASFPSRTPVSRKEPVVPDAPVDTPLAHTIHSAHTASSPSASSPASVLDDGSHSCLHSSPSDRTMGMGAHKSYQRHSTVLRTRTSSPMISSSRSTHSEPGYTHDRHEHSSNDSSPRKLRKPPPEPKRSEASPDHGTNYIYLRHADVPMDPPLQPIASYPPAQTKDSSSPAQTEWQFPLDLAMHELYHGTSQKFRISTSDGAHHSVKVVIPPGTLPGARVDALPGVVFEVRERPHACLMRVKTRPYDLFMCCELPWSVDGDIPDGHISLSGPGGEDFQVALPRGLAEGTEGTRIPGKGMPIQKGRSVIGYGDLYIRWDFFTETKKSKTSGSKWDAFKKIIHIPS